MLRSAIPTKMPVVFASGAGGGFVTPVPNTPSATPGRASFQVGFPPETFEQIAAGGTPPWGADMNGILEQITAWLQWSQAGGFPIKYDAAFSASIGGYPQYALLLSSSPGSYGKMWLSKSDNNTANPDSAGQTTWVPFPDVLIQLQSNNYVVDTGAANQVTVDFGRRPVSWAEIVGMPARIKALHANTVNNPTLNVMSAAGTPLSPATMVNPGGAVLGIGQYTTNDIIEGIPKDDGTFQVNSPVAQFSPTGTFPIPGFIMPWPTETAPSGFLECDGRSLLISSYPSLWGVLGTRYGGDGVNNFRLPDCRGEFLRGWDHGRGLDPNAGTRGNAGGGITGDHVGTVQGYALNVSGAPFTLANPLASATSVWSEDPPGYSQASGLAQGNFLSYTPTMGGGGGGWGASWLGSINANSSPPYSFGGLNWTGAITGSVSISTGGEVRPVNLNVMWVIFTG